MRFRTGGLSGTSVHRGYWRPFEWLARPEKTLSMVSTSISAIMTHTAGVVARSVADVVFPPTCALCCGVAGAESGFCDGCLCDLRVSETMMRSRCPRCAGSPVSGNASVENRCPQCRSGNWNVDRTLALWAYQGRVREAIVAAKFARSSGLAMAFGTRVADAWLRHSEFSSPTMVTFVPSHRSRQLTRGGTGTRTIAAAVAKRLSVPILPVLRATRRIQKQAWLDDEERIRNVCGAFAVRKSYAPLSQWASRRQLMPGSHVLVVDDVMTSGATCNEVAGALRQAGVARVTIAVVARAVRR